MKNLLKNYKDQLLLLIGSSEYDDELISELGNSFINDYRMHLSGLPYPPIYLADDEVKAELFRKEVHLITKEVLSSVI